MQENNFDHAPVLADYEEMRLRFSTSLDLLMPEEGHTLRLLRGGEGLEPVSLRDALVEWMNQHLDEDGKFDPNRRELFITAPKDTRVAIQHMLDEYWWVELPPVREDESGALQPDTRDFPGIAILRVDESRDNLPVGYDHSPKLTPLTAQTAAAQRARVIEEFSRGL